MPDEFVWDVVAANVAALANLGALAGTGIKIRTTWPEPAEECLTPITFPARDPFVTLVSLEKRTFGARRAAHKVAVYDLNWIYLHVEVTQNTKVAEQEVKLMQQMSKVFDEITARMDELGVQRVVPAALTLDADYVSPVSGKTYMGARWSVRCTEFVHGRVV